MACLVWMQLVKPCLRSCPVLNFFRFCFLYFFSGSQKMSVGPIQTQSSLGQFLRNILFTRGVLLLGCLLLVSFSKV